MKLNDSYTLNIPTDKQLITTVSLFYQGKLQESVSIGNSLFDLKAVKFERFCPTCHKAYWIPIPDATSTYGAKTCVIAYSSRSMYWRIQILPITTKLVKTSKGDYYQLHDGRIRYEFEQGILAKAK